MRTLTAIAGASLALLAAAPAASADETIYAGFPSVFITPNVTIDQGEALSFTNLDVAGHDVTAKQQVNGKPLFASALTAAGGTEPVVGAQALKTGSYDFLCSIHPNMVGVLTVNSSGAPSDSPPPGSSGSTADTKAPSTKVKVLDSKLAAVRKRRAINVSVNSDEAAGLTITVRSGKTKVAYTTTDGKAGSNKVAVRLTPSGKKLVKKAKKLAVTVTVRAGDSAGNASNASAKKTLR
jgi:plastocyanin